MLEVGPLHVRSLHSEVLPNQLGLGITDFVEKADVTSHYNAAPGQEHWVIRRFGIDDDVADLNPSE